MNGYFFWACSLGMALFLTSVFLGIWAWITRKKEKPYDRLDKFPELDVDQAVSEDEAVDTILQNKMEPEYEGQKAGRLILSVENFQRFIQEEVDGNGLIREEVAKKAGVSRSAINKYMPGTEGWHTLAGDLYTARKLVKGLGYKLFVRWTEGPRVEIKLPYAAYDYLWNRVERKGLSTKDVAKATGLNHRTVYNALTQEGMRLDTFIKIVGAIGGQVVIEKK